MVYSSLKYAVDPCHIASDLFYLSKNVGLQRGKYSAELLTVNILFNSSTNRRYHKVNNLFGNPPDSRHIFIEYSFPCHRSTIKLIFRINLVSKTNPLRIAYQHTFERCQSKGFSESIFKCQSGSALRSEIPWWIFKKFLTLKLYHLCHPRKIISHWFFSVADDPVGVCLFPVADSLKIRFHLFLRLM